MFIYLYNQGLLTIPNVHNIPILTLSLIIVLLSFIIGAKAWELMLRSHINTIRFDDAIISNGKYVLSKYIPGKFWMIIGITGYIKEKHGKELLGLSSLLIYYQIILMLCGTIVSIWALFIVDKKVFYYSLITVFFFIMGYIFFNKVFMNILSKLLTKLFRKDISFPVLQRKIVFKVALLLSLKWLLISYAFYLYIFALYADNIGVSIYAGLLFPFSTVLGNIAIFAPGGIGVREGFLSLSLSSIDICIKYSTTIAFFSRLWFLAGEVLFFITGIIVEQFSKNKP